MEEIKGAIEKFRQELIVAGYSKRTIKMYLNYVEEFLSFLNKAPEQTAKEDIISFIAKKKEKDNLSNASISLIYSSLKYFYHNYLHLKIMDEIKMPRKEKKLPSVLSVEEVKKLIGATKRGRNRLVVQFLYSTGTRVSECANIKLNDLDLEQKIAKVRGGKGNKDRTIILSDYWVKELNKYLNKKNVKSEFVFSKKNGKPITTTTIERIVRKAAQKAGITKRVTAHTMRHSFATHLLESGENIRKIQELLGHENLSTTQIYTTISTAELKKTINPLDKLKNST
ncbi:MAG: site-specific tyrosine recombinase/integron integrase [Candidatus Diapherotrites archaeon]